MAKIIIDGQAVGLTAGSGGSDITFDDTMTTNDEGITGVTNPVKAVLTQAEYDALPEEERGKGLYVIKDGSSGSGNTSSGSSSEVYSEEETVIGTFLGKPLYRRVIRTTIPSGISLASSTELLPLSIPVDDFCTFKGMITSTSGQKYPVPTYLSNDDACWIGYNSPNVSYAPNSLRISGSSNHIGRQILIILEYTKTTD